MNDLINFTKNMERELAKKRKLRKLYQQHLATIKLEPEAEELQRIFLEIHKLYSKVFAYSFEDKQEVKETVKYLNDLVKVANKIAKEVNFETSI